MIPEMLDILMIRPDLARRMIVAAAPCSLVTVTIFPLKSIDSV